MEQQTISSDMETKPLNEITNKIDNIENDVIHINDDDEDDDDDDDIDYEKFDDDYVEQLQKLKIWLCPIEEKFVPEDATCSQTRRCLTRVVHSRALNITIVIMAVIDIMILITVLILEIEALKLPPGPKQDKLESARFGLECVSLSIIIIFTIEIGLKMFAFGIKEFCHHWIEILDAIVTLISLGTDILLLVVHIIKHNNPHTNHNHSNTNINQSKNDIVTIFSSAAGFLIIFRLWRIARIVNATLISITSVLNEKMENMRRHEAYLKRHIIKLEQKLRNYHIHYSKYEEKKQQQFDNFHSHQHHNPQQHHHHQYHPHHHHPHHK